jgi:outer membrane protein assembly factor BamD (BamD/ComL family)
LKEEAALLSRAQSALQSGDVAQALSALSEHREKFPRGVLRGEREAALSVAYCKSGDPRGKERAERFIVNNPDSPMVQRLRSACKLPME